MARLSTATRHNVVILRQQGLSQTKISKQTGVSRGTVQALLKKHKETGNVEDRRRSGRPRKLNAADDKLIKRIALRNRKMSSSAISSELAETRGTQVHPSTVRRSLARSGLHGGLQPKSHTSDIETRPSDSAMHENTGSGGQKNGSLCSGLMSQNVKYLAVAEGSCPPKDSISANGLGDLDRINSVLNAEKL